MVKIKTWVRISRSDKHGQGGGKLLEARYQEIPDEVYHHAVAAMMLDRAKNDIGRQAVKQAAKEVYGIDMDNPKVALPW